MEDTHGLGRGGNLLEAVYFSIIHLTGAVGVSCETWDRQPISASLSILAQRLREMLVPPAFRFSFYRKNTSEGSSCYGEGKRSFYVLLERPLGLTPARPPAHRRCRRSHRWGIRTKQGCNLLSARHLMLVAVTMLTHASLIVTFCFGNGFNRENGIDSPIAWFSFRSTFIEKMPSRVRFFRNTDAAGIGRLFSFCECCTAKKESSCPGRMSFANQHLADQQGVGARGVVLCRGPAASGYDCHEPRGGRWVPERWSDLTAKRSSLGCVSSAGVVPVHQLFASPVTFFTLTLCFSTCILVISLTARPRLRVLC